MIFKPKPIIVGVTFSYATIFTSTKHNILHVIKYGADKNVTPVVEFSVNIWASSNKYTYSHEFYSLQMDGR